MGKILEITNGTSVYFLIEDQLDWENILIRHTFLIEFWD